MKQFKIVNAYQTLEQLASNENLTEKEQWDIYKLRKALRPHIEFRDERVAAIQEKYRDDIDEQGNIHGEQAVKYLNEIQAVNNLDIELEELSKPKVKFAKGMNCKITEPLEDFIEFTEPAE